MADRTPRDSFYHCLKNSAHQCHNKQGEEQYVLAGDPWFKCRARDLFISLPCLTLSLGELDEFDDVMNMQRVAVYTKRRHALMGERIGLDIVNMIWDRCVYAVELGDYDNVKMEILQTLAM